ncbi:Major facilitator superfamily MFS_1 [Planoprotostelium fungivorum]|uniref:Major facilitator superfamily MFS_1 n=1 Tax=Planoprotostelium fungivorum TaxID=1890364 RepID=A0A2P6NVD0_9EUKA|nr:Major facilitator superfamily MFS_1 [Planoprotostelium fungivorum]
MLLLLCRVAWLSALFLFLLKTIWAPLDELTTYGRLGRNKVLWPILSNRASWTLGYTFATVWSVSCWLLLWRSQDLSIFTSYWTSFLYPLGNHMPIRAHLYMFVFGIQVSRRATECIFVHRFTDRPISIINTILALSFYAFAVLSPPLEILHRTTSSPSNVDLSWFDFLAIMIFFYSSLQQCMIHMILSKQEKKKGRYCLPKEAHWKEVVCPHYFHEIVIYACLWVISGAHLFSSNTLIFLFVSLNLSKTAIMTRKTYEKEGQKVRRFAAEVTARLDLSSIQPEKSEKRFDLCAVSLPINGRMNENERKDTRYVFLGRDRNREKHKIRAPSSNSLSGCLYLYPRFHSSPSWVYFYLSLPWDEQICSIKSVELLKAALDIVEFSQTWTEMESCRLRGDGRFENHSEPHAQATSTSTRLTLTTNNTRITMMKGAAILLLLTILSAAVADTCSQGYSYCPDVNSCYDTTQYTCEKDKFNGNNRLCAVGTTACNDICIASCAYQCNADGSYSVLANRTCPPPPTCLGANSFACGEACYDSTKFCCVSGQPQDISACPDATSSVCDDTADCPFGIFNLGSLADGQLRLNFGPGASSVNFTLKQGALVDNRGHQCYISSSGQLQCDQVPQTSDTSFCTSGDYLSHKGSLVWYACAIGTGGSNIYTASIDARACSATYLYVTPNCPATVATSSVAPTQATTSSAAPTKAPTSSAAPTTSAAPTSSAAPTKASTSSAAPTTSAAPTKASTSSAAPTTSAAPTSSVAPTKASTTSAAPTTSAVVTKSSTYVPSSTIAPSTTPSVCIPGGISIPVPFCYFSFDFGISLGGIIKDDSGKGRHGTCLGQPKSVKGLFNLGLSVDASVGFQGLRVDKVAGLGGSFSFATWLKISAGSDKTMKIVSTKSGLFSLISGWELSLCPTTKSVSFSSGFQSVSWNIDFTAEAYFHLAFTADANGKVTLYINGVAGASQTVRISKCTGSLYIASDKSNCNFKGHLDDFLAFDVCLTIEQIISIINNRCTTTATTALPSGPKPVTGVPEASKPATKPATKPSEAPKPTEASKPATKSSEAPKSSTPSASSSPSKPKKTCGLPWSYWSFDNNKDGKCNDDSGHGRHASYSGSWDQTIGKLRKGCQWKSDKSLHLNVPSCNLYKSFTVATWVKFDSCSGNQVLATTKGLLSGWEIAFDGDKKQFVFTSSLGSQVWWDASSVQANVWVHVSLAVDSTTAECFINGDSCGSKKVAACSAGISGLKIGAKPTLLGTTSQLKGSLDEFLVFDKVLDREQVCDARDKYQTGADVPSNNWSKQTTSSLDWGVDWEHADLPSSRADRLVNWWKF